MSRSLKVATVATVVTLAIVAAAAIQGRTHRLERALEDVPSTAQAVLRLDTRELARSAAAQTLLAAIVPPDRLSEIESTCGLDPMGTLAEVVAWVRGTEEQPVQAVGLMLRGRTVDAADLASCHRTLVEARGGDVVRIDSGSGPLLASRDRRSAVALLDSQRIVTGAVRTVAEAVAVSRGAAPSLAEGSPLAEVWPEIARSAAIVGALDPPDRWKSAIARAMRLGDRGAALQAMRLLSVSTADGKAHTLTVRIDADDPGSAKAIAATLETWLASPPEDLEPPWDALSDSARVDTRGSAVTVTLSLASLSTDR